jgi:hypothetical protein
LSRYSPLLHYNLSMKWNCPFFSRREVKISQPFSVTSSVCSNWADSIPSTVTAVHLSGHISSRQLPVLQEQYESHAKFTRGVKSKYCSLNTTAASHMHFILQWKTPIWRSSILHFYHLAILITSMSKVLLFKAFHYIVQIHCSQRNLKQAFHCTYDHCCITHSLWFSYCKNVSCGFLDCDAV